MSKNNEERLYKLRHELETELPQVIIYTDFEGTYLHIIYNGESVCKTLLQKRDGYSIEFEREFVFDDHPSITWRSTSDGVVSCIRSRIRYYDEKKGLKSMTNKHFIVENMEVKMNNFGPDVINMTIRKDPDGLIPKTGKELKALIESLDPDKLSSDNRININVDNNTVEKQIYMMSARGNGKTQWVSEQIKKACKGVPSIYTEGIRHTYPSILFTATTMANNIKDVIFNDPATIVFWTDGSKTVVKCEKGETFDPEKGLAMAISKKVLGNDYGYYETFAKYIGRYHKKHGIITPNEVFYNGRTYVLSDKYTVKTKEKEE